MKNKNCISLITFIIILCWSSQCFSLEVDTHEAINKHIATNSVNGFSLDNYVRNNLSFKAGRNEVLKGVDATGIERNKEVFWWVGYGGIHEDRPGSMWDYIQNNPTRSVNHFHNPVKPNWDDAGLNDSLILPKPIPVPPFLLWEVRNYTGQSSVLWSQNSNQDVGDKWSWQDARENFFIALTGKDFSGILQASNEAERDIYFADTFRAVGQLMHLVEDASVPAHVRNDIHIPKPIKTYAHYEQTIERLRTEDISFWNNLLANPITFDKSILDIAIPNSSAPVPIARIIDTDLYNGDNPDDTTTIHNSPQYIGIAEYTNANFFSNDTIFNHLNFNYPNISNTVLWTDNDDREYIRKVGSGDTINHLARTSLLYSYRQIYFPQYTEHLPVGLDEECYREYAENLIPRAVGYSAGLLNYFFRGEIDLVKDDVTGSGYVIVNNTEEDMDGTFEIYYDNVNDERNLLWSSSFALDTLSSGNNTSGNISFTVPGDAKLSGSYIVVFRGRLGNEADAVVPYIFQTEARDFVIMFDDGGQTKYAFLNQSQIDNGEQVAIYDYPVDLNISPPFMYTAKSYIHRGKKLYILNGKRNLSIWVPPYAYTSEYLKSIVLYDPELKQFFNFPGVTSSITEYTVSDDYIYLFNPGYKVVYYEPGVGVIPVLDVSTYPYLRFVDSNGILHYRGSYTEEYYGHYWYPVMTYDIWTGSTADSGLKEMEAYFYGPLPDYLCPGINHPANREQQNVTLGTFLPVTRVGENDLSYTLAEYGFDFEYYETCTGTCNQNGICSLTRGDASLEEFFLDNHFYSSIATYERVLPDPGECIGRDINFDRINQFSHSGRQPWILSYPFIIENINNSYVAFFEMLAVEREEVNCWLDHFDPVQSDYNKEYRLHLKTPSEDLVVNMNSFDYFTPGMNQRGGLFFEDQYRESPVRIHGTNIEFITPASNVEIYPIYDINNNRIEQKLSDCLGGIAPESFMMIFPID